jgi:hypothetical protein
MNDNLEENGCGTFQVQTRHKLSDKEVGKW